jgi:amidohydrolase
MLNDRQKCIVQAVDGAAGKIISVSHQIHDHPELGYEEVFAAQLLSKTLEEYGFKVEGGYAGIPTAFCARKGAGKGPSVAFLAEYDALPEIGHACGHNVIAASALSAGIGLGSIVEDLSGEVLVIGTPAEETDGAKVTMVKRGCFDEIDAALMVHPYNGDYTHTEAAAYDAIKVSFYGKSTHAAASPWEGKNALDAILLTFSNINALRQQMRPDGRIHGIISHGGTAPNIIPDFTEARFYVRAQHRSYLEQLVEQFKACARGAAEATGTRMEMSNYENSFDEMINNTTLALRARDYLVRELGGKEPKRAPDTFGSVDMGNVSSVVPGVHLLVDITGGKPIGLHTREFAQAAISKQAEAAILRSGKALALTGYDLLTDQNFLRSVRQEFIESTGHSKK